MTLDDESDEAGTGDKAEGAFGDVDNGRIEQDASPYNTFATSELASGPTKSIGESGSWYDVEEGRYTEGPCKQQGMPSTPAQDQPQTLPQSSKSLQDQTNQQGVSKVSAISLGACQWSLRSTPCLSFPTAAMMDGLMTAWLN